MKYLLDVSTLVAWGWIDHDYYSIVDHWVARESKKEHVLFLTSPIAELGFVRISMQRDKSISLQEATKMLHKILHALAPSHRFLPDDLAIGNWPSWCTNASQTTDAHLLLLAKKHGAQLATLDRKIPGAFLIR
jgi:predicted nucleic acid-binding protein